jgi:protein tyrosine/serine phosphatase
MKPNIYWIPGPWAGKLAILARPRGGDWLTDEVEGWREADVQVIVSLLSEEETRELGLADEAQVVEANGLNFISFTINDYDVPSSEGAVRQLVNHLEELLAQGQNVGIHCRAGVGRSSLVAACLFVDQGEDTEISFQRIGTARGLTVPDTVAQREWVSEFARASHSERSLISH